MTNTRRLTILALAMGATIAACGDKGSKDAGSDDSTANKPSVPTELRIVAGENSPAPADPKLIVITPASEEIVQTDSVIVKVKLDGFELQSPTAGEVEKGIAYSKEGQHIHVIIDDKPYMAMYTPEGFSVGALSEGVHTLRAFPSRSWHESIKAPHAFVAHTFYVKTKTGDIVHDPIAPLLTYSRPKGEYKGADAARILLDFYVSNCELGPDKFKVIATIDGALTDTLTQWVPYFIEGMPKGEHTIHLRLIGPDGKPVAGPFNDVERKITVDPTAEPQ